MRYLTDIADWWDARKTRVQHSLDVFVAENPNQFGFLIATATFTSMEVGATLVDLLRLGDGVSQGTLKGTAQDGLRLIGVLGPLGKGFQMLKNASQIRLAKLISDPGGGICSWIAATKALAQTGYRQGGKFFASVDDLARAVGIRKIGGVTLSEMANNLRRIGVSIGPEFPINSMQQVKMLLPRDGSVVQVSFRMVRNSKTINGHAMYVFYDSRGMVCIMDRTGVYKNLAAVAKKYQIDEFVPRYAVRINSVFAKIIGPKGTATLAVQVKGVAFDEKK